METVQERDELALQLARRGEAEFSGFLADINNPDPRHGLTKSKKDREAEAADDQWRRFREGCEVEAAGGHVGDSPLLTGHERLRSERVEPEMHERMEKVLAKKATDTGPERQRVLRALSVVKRAQAAYALGEEPSADLIAEFREAILEK